jgi:hypothetical protein
MKVTVLRSNRHINNNTGIVERDGDTLLEIKQIIIIYIFSSFTYVLEFYFRFKTLYALFA